MSRSLFPNKIVDKLNISNNNLIFTGNIISDNVLIRCTIYSSVNMLFIASYKD